MINQFVFIKAFIMTLIVSHCFGNRKYFSRWQNKRLHKWMVRNFKNVDFYKTHPCKYLELPIIDKSILMNNFAAFNKAKLTKDMAFETAEGREILSDYHIGMSTGTSGNRGLFVITEKEIYIWLGTILAKTLPRFMFKKHRIAVILPRNTELYNKANSSRFLSLKFFNLTKGLDQWLADIEVFNPSCIIAPPKVLRYMSEIKLNITPNKIYSVAETLDPIDKDIIQTYFKKPLGQIYMATEGLFAVTCSKGNIHLAEDSTYFELVPEAGGLHSILITGFKRETQIMARYRMNDLIKLSDKPCSCGSPLITIDEIVGRCDDSFDLLDRNGKTIVFTPDILRNLIIDADRKINDFRLKLVDNNSLHLMLEEGIFANAKSHLKQTILSFFNDRNINIKIQIKHQHFTVDYSKKLRRIENKLEKH